MKKGFLVLTQVCSGLGEGALSIYIMKLISTMVDRILAVDIQTISSLFLIFVLLVIAQTVFIYIHKWSCLSLRKIVTEEMSLDIYKAVVLSERRIDDRSHLLSFYQNKISQVTDYVVNKGEQIINLITAIMAIVFMVRINVILLIVSVSVIPLSGYIISRLNIKFLKANNELLEAKENTDSAIRDIVDGFYLIKVYSLQEKFIKFIRKRISEQKNREKNSDSLLITWGRFRIVLRFLPQLITPLFGGFLCFRNEISIGELVAANSLVWLIVNPLEQLLEYIKTKNEIYTIEKSIEEMCRVEAPKIQERERLGKGRIELKNVAFSYGDGNAIIENAFLYIEGGEHVVISGESGSGKTTLLRLLCLLETEYSGEIIIDGETYRSNDTRARDIISYVPQNPHIFSASISDNITMGAIVDDEKMRQILEIVDFEKELCKFPDRLDTIVGDGGVVLSGGQRKKIGMARALLEQSVIYLFDEPLAGIDGSSAKKIIESISRYLNGKTMVIVSHEGCDIVSQLRRIDVRKDICGKVEI